MRSSPPKLGRSHTLASSSPFHSGYGMTTSTAVSSSKESVDTLTPLEADEEYIDRLWEQVRSKSKSSLDITVPAEEKKVQGKAVAEQGVVKVSKPSEPRISRRPSLTFRDSSNGKNTMAVLNLPGVQKANVHVSFQYKRIIISYKAVEETEQWEPDKVIQEVRRRRCVRAIPIPESVRPEHIRATMPDHRLFISYPKCV